MSDYYNPLIMPQSYEIKDREGYLARMVGPTPDKLRMGVYFPAETRSILDIGCADGAITREFAKMFPQAQVLGVDLDAGFIEQATASAKDEDVSNVSFENVYVRDILDRGQTFDVVTSVSTNHEIYSWGGGKLALVGALTRLADMLNPGGVMGIRDMILYQSTRSATLMCPEVLEKIRAKKRVAQQLSDHEALRGTLRTQEDVNHFLLKYMYTQNWEKELEEFYLPFSAEEYAQILGNMGMQIEHQEYYLLPYLAKKWRRDFGLTKAELSVFGSTGLIIASRNDPDTRLKRRIDRE